MAKPKFLYDNVFKQTIVASSVAAGFAAANVADWRHYTWYQPAALPATLDVDCGAPRDVDYALLYGHDVGSQNATVEIFGSDYPFGGANLFPSPEDMASGWTLNGMSAVANATTAPDGTTTAEKLVESAVNEQHRSYRVISTSLAGKQVVHSVFAKAAERSKVRLVESSGPNILFDISAGTAVVAGGTPHAYGIRPVGGGWFRCWFSHNESDASTVVQVHVCDASGASTYAGDGASGLFVWGAMSHEGRDIGAYVSASGWVSTDARVAVFGGNLLSAPHFSAGVTDAPTRAGLLSAVSSLGWGTDFPSTGLAFGHDGATLSVAYKSHAHVVGVTYRIQALVKMDDGGAPAFGSATSVSSLNDFVFIINGFTVPMNTASVTALGSGVFAVSGVLAAAPGGNANVGIVKYATNSPRTFKVTGYYLTADGAVSDYILPSNPPVLKTFTKTRKRYWRARITGSAAPSLAILAVGSALEVPTWLPQGFDPLTRKVVGQTNRNANGHGLGKVIDFEEWSQQLRFERVAWSWLRETWLPAWRAHLRSAPFALAWDTDTDPANVKLLTADDEFSTPHYAGSTADLTLGVTGVAT